MHKLVAHQSRWYSSGNGEPNDGVAGSAVVFRAIFFVKKTA